MISWFNNADLVQGLADDAAAQHLADQSHGEAWPRNACLCVVAPPSAAASLTMIVAISGIDQHFNVSYAECCSEDLAEASFLVMKPS